MKIARFAVTILLAFASADAMADWVACAKEDGFCAFDGRREVAYGAGSKWVSKVFTGGVKCASNKFGGDPAPGVPKTCRVRAAAGEDVSPRIDASWVRCADEGQACRFSGTRKVAFGADKRFKYRVMSSGAACTNETFGGDPAFGVRKACYYNPRQAGS